MRADVVKWAVQRRPDVLLQIGNVIRINRLEQLAGDGLSHPVGCYVEGIHLDRMGGKACDRLIHADKGRDLDVDIVLLAERSQKLLVDIIRVHEHSESAAGLGLEPAVDWVFEDGQLHRMCWPGQRDPTGTDQLTGHVGPRCTT